MLSVQAPPPPGGSPDTVTTRGIITYSTCRARSPRDTYCDLCHCYRPPNGVHYLDCDACCAGYDHHCPWTGTCIGEGNLRWFYLFVSHIFGFMIYLAVVSAMVFHQPTGRKHGLLI